jgi:hypothetical protein
LHADLGVADKWIVGFNPARQVWDGKVVDAKFITMRKVLRLMPFEKAHALAYIVMLGNSFKPL